jgi:hypothetical protein
MIVVKNLNEFKFKGDYSEQKPRRVHSFEYVKHLMIPEPFGLKQILLIQKDLVGAAQFSNIQSG